MEEAQVLFCFLNAPGKAATRTISKQREPSGDVDKVVAGGEALSTFNSHWVFCGKLACNWLAAAWKVFIYCSTLCAGGLMGHPALTVAEACKCTAEGHKERKGKISKINSRECAHSPDLLSLPNLCLAAMAACLH